MNGVLNEGETQAGGWRFGQHFNDLNLRLLDFHDLDASVLRCHVNKFSFDLRVPNSSMRVVFSFGEACVKIPPNHHPVEPSSDQSPFLCQHLILLAPSVVKHISRITGYLLWCPWLYPMDVSDIDVPMTWYYKDLGERVCLPNLNRFILSGHSEERSIFCQWHRLYRLRLVVGEPIS